jgi:hypothetical protein
MRRTSSKVVVAVWACLGLVVAACGSTAPGLPFADGGSPRTDGGTTLDDGGAPAEDGGVTADGGGVLVDGGAPGADGGSPIAWKIVPGEGLDVASASATTTQLRVGQTRAQVRSRVGDGSDSPLFAGALDRLYEGGAYLVFYSNTDQSNDGLDPPTPTFTDSDTARYMSVTSTFPGKTAGGTGPGSVRSAWRAEFGAPDLTQVNLDNVAETRDFYFGRGLWVGYGSNDVATSYTVSRAFRKPDVRIELARNRLGNITAASSNGTSFGTVLSEWGAPDQVDDYTVAAVFPARNYTYVGLGLVFVTQAGVIDRTDYRVSAIIFFDPYYGKADVANLGLRSTRNDLDAALVTSTCQTQASNFLNQSWRIYRWNGSSCTMRLGVTFDSQNRARTWFLNFPSGV